MLRVITGKAKGRKLKAPKGLSTRPTSDRVKESIFNIIGDISYDSYVLDLFSGSGGIGIEFLSRGAEVCYFIDKDSASVKIIIENLENTNLINQGFVYKNDVNRAIKILSSKNILFNYIFMDPPYEKKLVIPTLETICNYKILHKKGIVIVEHETKLELPDEILYIRKYDTRKYGGTSVSFFRLEEV